MTARGEQTRVKLLTATREVVRRVGYARATTRAIAEAAGVSEGTIYRHFPDKRQMFLAAALDRHGSVLEWMADLPARAGEGTVRDNLTESLRRLGRLRADLLPLEFSLRTDPELARDLHAVGPGEAGPGTMGPDQAGLPALAAEGPPQLLAAYLRGEQSLGRIRAEVDPERAAVTILAALFGLAMLPNAPDVELPADRLDDAVDLLLRGLQG